MALAMTFMFAIGLTAWSYAHNKKAALVNITPENYYNGVNCEECIPETYNPAEFECTTQQENSLRRCQCTPLDDMTPQNATTSSPGGSEVCQSLYLHEVI